MTEFMCAIVCSFRVIKGTRLILLPNDRDQSLSSSSIFSTSFRRLELRSFKTFSRSCSTEVLGLGLGFSLTFPFAEGCEGFGRVLEGGFAAFFLPCWLADDTTFLACVLEVKATFLVGPFDGEGTFFACVVADDFAGVVNFALPATVFLPNPFFFGGFIVGSVSS